MNLTVLQTFVNLGEIVVSQKCPQGNRCFIQLTELLAGSFKDKSLGRVLDICNTEFYGWVLTSSETSGRESNFEITTQ